MFLFEKVRGRRPPLKFPPAGDGICHGGVSFSSLFEPKYAEKETLPEGGGFLRSDS